MADIYRIMLSIRFTRFTNNYGPYQFPEKLIPKTIIRVSLGLKIPIYGTGKNIRNWIHVEDHYRAVKNVLMSGKPGEIYNVSSGAEKNNQEIVRTILNSFGKDRDDSSQEYVEDRPGHDLSYSLETPRGCAGSWDGSLCTALSRGLRTPSDGMRRMKSGRKPWQMERP